jgi:hypothetical protein
MWNLKKYQPKSSDCVGQSDRKTGRISEYFNNLGKNVEWRRSVVWLMSTPDRAKKARTRIVMAAFTCSKGKLLTYVISLMSSSLYPFHSTQPDSNHFELPLSTLEVEQIIQYPRFLLQLLAEDSLLQM